MSSLGPYLLLLNLLRSFFMLLFLVTQVSFLLIMCSSFHMFTLLNFMYYGFCPHTSIEIALHCFYLFLKLTCFHSHSMKLTFLPYWLFLSLLLISQQTIDIHKSSFDCHLLCSTNLPALTNLFTPKSLTNFNILCKTKSHITIFQDICTWLFHQ